MIRIGCGFRRITVRANVAEPWYIKANAEVAMRSAAFVTALAMCFTAALGACKRNSESAPASGGGAQPVAIVPAIDPGQYGTRPEMAVVKAPWNQAHGAAAPATPHPSLTNPAAIRERSAAAQRLAGSAGG